MSADLRVAIAIVLACVASFGLGCVYGHLFRRRLHWMGGAVCPTHGKAVLVTHVDDSEPCTDYLLAALQEPK